MSEQSWNVLVIGEREALSWVLSERRMAFPMRRRLNAHRLRPGDGLLLYTTRGAFHNPTRDRGRVIGEARVTSPAVDLDPPITVAGRDFTTACDIESLALAPMREGVELAPLVPEMRAFPDPRTWSVHLRRPLVPLPRADANHLRRRLRSVACEPSAVLGGVGGGYQ